MAKMLNNSQAGSLESGDILITLVPGEVGSGRIIELQCPVEIEFGRQIRQTIIEVLQQFGIEDVRVGAHDKGTMDFTLRARMETAARRALGGNG